MAARAAVVASPSLRAEVLNLRGLTNDLTYDAYTPDVQIVVPLEGAHYLSAGRTEVLVDLNQIGLISADVLTRDRHPSVGDTACLVITPSRCTLDEIWHGTGTTPESLAARGFCTRTAPAITQYAASIASYPARTDLVDPPNAREEMLLGVARRAVCDATRPPVRLGGKSLKLVLCVKELLATSPGSLSLTQIASRVGASPAYLTDLFRRAEGMPVYRYQLRLRLAMALRRLPEVDDITGLALDLGFSSHSHFTAVFKSVFGVTPSTYRESTRPVQRRGVAVGSGPLALAS